MADSDSDAFQSADEGSDLVPEVQNIVLNVSGEPHLQNLKQLTIEDKKVQACEKEVLIKPSQHTVKGRSPKPFTNTLGAKRISTLQNQTEGTKPAKPVRQRIPLRIEQKIKERNEKALKLEKERNEKAMKLEKDRLEKLAKPDSSEYLLDNNKPESKISNSWGLGSWSSSLFSSAASTVSNLSSQVGQGFETVMETVEASLGLPNPTELVETLNKQRDSIPNDELFYAPCGKINTDEEVDESNGGDSTDGTTSYDTPKYLEADAKKSQVSETGLFGDFSAFTKVLENTSNLVVQGSLGTLEMLGKKTMDLITEQDPTSKKTKLLIGSDTISLSDALKEVKDKNENFNHLDNQTKPLSFLQFLDKFNSFKHLEFLESISQLAESRVQEILQSTLKEERDVVNEEYSALKNMYKDVPSFEDISDDEEFDHDFETLVKEHITNLNLPVAVNNLLDVQKRSRDWIKKCDADLDEDTPSNLQDLHAKSLERIAELVAATMEHYFQVGKVMYNSLAQPNCELSETESRYCSLFKLSETLCNEVGIEALRFSHLLNKVEDPSEEQKKTNTLVTEMFLETSNSYTYIQEGYFLLEPILHLGFLQQPVVLTH